MGKRGPKKGATYRSPLNDDDMQKLIGMMQIGCTRDEICKIMGLSDDTLNRRLKARGAGNFAALFKKHYSEGNMSLRRAQIKAALDGNATMLVWLGKQRLGQTDKIDQTSSDGSTRRVIFEIVGVKPGQLPPGAMAELPARIIDAEEPDGTPEN